MKHVLDIQGAIKRHGYSINYVAKKLGVTPTAVSIMGKGKKPKSGEPRSVQIDTLEKIANAIHCDLFDLWITTDDNGVQIFPFNHHVVSIDRTSFIDKLKDDVLTLSKNQKNIFGEDD